MLPFTPMSPILANEIPMGEEWGHQLKWDGFRVIALIDEGSVQLFSKNLLTKNSKYPDLVQALAGLQLQGTYLLDGEAVVMDAATNRPSFQKMQKRDKLSHPGLIKKAALNEPIQYIIFDLLQAGQEILRGRPFRERHERLQQLAGNWGAPFFLVDLFEDGDALWNWVLANGWEGVVSKRLSSRYQEGKDHRDWFKRKTVLQLDIEIVGVIMKEGRVSSLVMRKDSSYLGRISSGLDSKAKENLLLLKADKTREDYFTVLPEGLKGAHIRWLDVPLPSKASAMEITESGQLRHPKLLELFHKKLSSGGIM